MGSIDQTGKVIPVPYELGIFELERKTETTSDLTPKEMAISLLNTLKNAKNLVSPNDGFTIDNFVNNIVCHIRDFITNPSNDQDIKKEILAVIPEIINIVFDSQAQDFGPDNIRKLFQCFIIEYINNFLIYVELGNDELKTFNEIILNLCKYLTNSETGAPIDMLSSLVNGIINFRILGELLGILTREIDKIEKSTTLQDEEQVKLLVDIHKSLIELILKVFKIAPSNSQLAIDCHGILKSICYFSIPKLFRLTLNLNNEHLTDYILTSLKDVFKLDPKLFVVIPFEDIQLDNDFLKKVFDHIDAIVIANTDKIELFTELFYRILNMLMVNAIIELFTREGTYINKIMNWIKILHDSQIEIGAKISIFQSFKEGIKTLIIEILPRLFKSTILDEDTFNQYLNILQTLIEILTFLFKFKILDENTCYIYLKEIRNLKREILLSLLRSTNLDKEKYDKYLDEFDKLKKLDEAEDTLKEPLRKKTFYLPE